MGLRCKRCGSEEHVKRSHGRDWSHLALWQSGVLNHPLGSDHASPLPST